MAAGAERVIDRRRFPIRLPDEAIPPREVARLVGVSVTTVRRWICNGHILAYRVGPQLLRIPYSEVVRMRRHRVISAKEGHQPVYRKV